MTRKKFFSLVLVLALMFLYRYFRDKSELSENTPTNAEEQERTAPAAKGEDAYLKSLQAHPLEYSKHALCRMDCRHIDESEVIEILQQGTINWKKSDLNDKPCPSYALEGTTHDRQAVRIVFAGCEDETRVITAIDLDSDWKCDCY